MNKIKPDTHRLYKIKEYYREGGISEVVSRSFMLGTRKLCTNIICKGKPENIPTPANSILYIDSTNSINGMGIGDSIGRLPTLQAIAKKYKTRIDVLCQANRYFIFKAQEGFGEVFTNSSSLSSHFKQLSILKAQNYSGAILVKPDWTYLRLFPLLCNLPKIILSQPGNPYINRTEELYNSAEIQGFVNDNEGEIPAPKIVPNSVLISKIPRTPGKKRVILYTEAKSALRSYKNWRAIISDIWRIDNNTEIILLGETKRIIIPEGIPVHDLRSQTPSLQDVMAELQFADIFIGADGGMTHLSMALGTPTITISSVSPVNEFIQLNRQLHVIPIVGPCPNKEPCGILAKSKGFRCEISGQSMFDHTQSPPCLGDGDMIVRKQIYDGIRQILRRNN